MLSPYRYNANPPTGATSGKPLLVEPSGSIGFPIQVGVTDILSGTATRVLFEASDNTLGESAGLTFDDATDTLTVGGPVVVSGQIKAADGSIAAPSISFASDPDTGIFWSSSGVYRFTANQSNSLVISGINLILNATGSIGFGGSGISNPNITLFKDADGTMALRNTTTPTSANSFRVYNTYTSSTNNEYGSLSWKQTANEFWVNTAKGSGGGTARRLILSTDNTGRWSVGATTGHLTAYTDNTYDIGATGATRPRSIYIGTSLNIEANAGIILTNQTDGAGAGAGTLANAPHAGDPDFWIPISVNGTPGWTPWWHA